MTEAMPCATYPFRWRHGGSDNGGASLFGEDGLGNKVFLEWTPGRPRAEGVVVGRAGSIVSQSTGRYRRCHSGNEKEDFNE